MTAWTGTLTGTGTKGKYPPADGASQFKEPIKMDLYDKYVVNAAQTQGIISIVYIPKGVTVAANDTLTLTISS
jgi:hypothetical protein